MANPFKALEEFLDSNIESGNIWYYVIGIIVIVLYIIVKNKFF